jgi:hypothetical protein
LEVKTTGNRGGIVGVVVDAAIRPLGGVVVTLTGKDRSATTTSEGQFGFDLLDPGTYFLETNMTGFLVSQSSVQVEAGQTAYVRILMEGDGKPLSRHSTEHFVGHIAATDQPGTQDSESQWTTYPGPGFATFVLEGTGTTSFQRPPNPTNASQFRQISYYFLDQPMTHGVTGVTDFPFTVYVPGDTFLDSTDEITLRVRGNLWPNEMQYDIFLTTFYVDPPPPGWSKLNGDE